MLGITAFESKRNQKTHTHTRECMQNIMREICSEETPKRNNKVALLHLN